MKKKLNAGVLSIILIMLMSIVLAGCNTSKVVNSTSTSKSAQGSKLTLTTVDGVEYPKLDVKDKNVSFLVHWDVKDPNYAAIIERMKKVYGIEIKTVKTTYTQLPTKLASLQAAGNAPDVFISYNAGFPTMYSKDMFIPIDDFVDFNDSFWAPAKSTSDMFAWNSGKHYMIAEALVARYCWYNKKLFERNGLESPLELYKSGKWTWEAAITAAKELTQDTDRDGNIDQWGLSGDIQSPMFASKNTNFVTINNGEITSNLKSTEIDSVMNLLYTVTNTDKSYTWDWQSTFRSGKLGMTFEGNWITAGDGVLSQMLKDGDIGFVPFPMFEGQKDKIYYSDYTGYLISKGAKNIPGAQAFLSAMWGYNKSEKAKSDWETANQNNGWSKDMIDIFKSLNFGTKAIAGPPNATCGDSLRFMYEPLRLMQDGNQTWTQIKESLYPLFQTEIDKEKTNMKK